MDINSFVIGLAKGKKSGSGYFSTKENDAGGLTYAFKAKESKGVELNIAYGEEPPDDTTMLWCKTSEPSGVVVSESFEGEEAGGIRTLSEVLPEGSINTTSVTVGTKIYLFSGQDYNNRTNTIRCFDTETQTITTLSTTLPENRNPATAQLLGTKVYLFGGEAFGNRARTILCFDTENETITTLSATLPSVMADYTASAIKGSKIYLMGGRHGTTAIYCFDTETETTTTLSAVLSDVQMIPAFATVGNKLYLLGGISGSNFVNTILCFDMENETITTLSTTVPTVYLMRASVIGTKIYLFGGTNTHDVANSITLAYDTIYCFDTESETITQMTEVLPKKQVVATAATVGNAIYLFGGKITSVYNNVLSTIYRFAEGFIVLSNDTLQIVPGDKTNVFPFINTDAVRAEIGVVEVYKGNENNHAEPVESALYKDGEWVTI